MTTENDELDTRVIALDRKRAEPRIKLIPFEEITLTTERRYLVKNLVPRVGLCVVWGPPKCGKSFWAFDLSMHVALGWVYRERRVQQGSVVYGAFEGSHGFGARIAAFTQKHLTGHTERVPFFLEKMTLNLVRDHAALIQAIKANDTCPSLVVLDTLNRSLQGSENSDEDMGAYVRAADAIREAFNCAVLIVHHCGIDGTRPRGHTSLTGACDAQLSVKRDHSGNVIVALECMKDGPEGNRIASKLEPIEVGKDDDGEAITSCYVMPVEAPAMTKGDERLTANQKTMYRILHGAGPSGLTLEDWYERARSEGIGTTRRATLGDLRAALHARGLVTETMNGWVVKGN